tara:strand:+ start:2093 stop:2350 length:258 start_codon:yes stop_codon:yes gene_type:complete
MINVKRYEIILETNKLSKNLLKLFTKFPPKLYETIKETIQVNSDKDSSENPRQNEKKADKSMNARIVKSKIRYVSNLDSRINKFH